MVGKIGKNTSEKKKLTAEKIKLHLKLVDAIKKQEVLWNVDHPDHNGDYEVYDAALMQLAKDVKLTKSEVIKKKSYIFSYHKKQERKGCKTWYLWDKMQFYRDYQKRKQNASRRGLGEPSAPKEVRGNQKIILETDNYDHNNPLVQELRKVTEKLRGTINLKIQVRSMLVTISNVRPN